MFLHHLSLAHFRSYRRLDLAFDGRLTLLQGLNGQGKTNLLEAIFYLATSKSTHARAEREVVGWSAEDEPIPYSRIGGRIAREGQETELEILFTPRKDGVNYTKQIRINGVGRRSIDLVGTLRAVLFLPEDIVLVAGSPSERRRYLDIALCQIDRQYCQHLARYQKVVSQRNSLLRQLRDEGASHRDAATGSQLGFWDDQLIRHGSSVLERRYRFLETLSSLASTRHSELSTGSEALQLLYLPSFNPGPLDESSYRRLAAGEYSLLPSVTDAALPSLSALETTFREKLETRRIRELQNGNTLYGPHRDDIAFIVNGRDLKTYGSRGQQRTGALALKLAEVQAMTDETGETPILLLDDVMSELDARRRGTLLQALSGVDQAIVTTTDWEDFSESFRCSAARLVVERGSVKPAAGEDSSSEATQQ